MHPWANLELQGRTRIGHNHVPTKSTYNFLGTSKCIHMCVYMFGCIYMFTRKKQNLVLDVGKGIH